MKYFHSSQSGFSLVETLVAITILLIIIVGPMTISSSTARSTSFASEQVIAFFLAQEGVEMVQKYRDDLLLQSFVPGADPADSIWELITDTSNGPLANCYKNNGCQLRFSDEAGNDSGQVVECTSNACSLTYDESARGRSRYRYTSSPTQEDTVYSRVINLEVVGTNSIKVESTVSWRTGDEARTQDVFVESYVYDVYGR
jgi:prepilin-type N-terminal cleavage/methylation domain-containing protein